MTEHEKKIKELEKYGSIEEWLYSQPVDEFPPYYPDKGHKSFPETYSDLKIKLIPLHKIVEKGALIATINQWRSNLKAENVSTEDREKFKDLLEHDPIIYLNQHGSGHVDKVIERAYDLITKFTSDTLSPSEAFLLLCAMQVHDTGNIFGRDGHEKSIRLATINTIKPIIPDVPTQNFIYKIAQVHGGNVKGNKDTISTLRQESNFFNLPIREQLLAAILRFSDELADDSSRADDAALDLDLINNPSAIYHHYSKSLHSVRIVKNSINQTFYISLEYFINSNLITKKFTKYNSKQLLIDEIFLRTKKIELERRYCMRFFGQYLPLSEVRVRIEINPEHDLTESEIIQYTLKENGYPADEVCDCPENTGEKIIAYLKNKGWRFPNE